MRTQAEIEEFLNTRLPDGPADERQEAVQDTLNWVLGIGPEPWID